MNVCATSCTPVLGAIYDWYLRFGGTPRTLIAWHPIPVTLYNCPFRSVLSLRTERREGASSYSDLAGFSVRESVCLSGSCTDLHRASGLTWLWNLLVQNVPIMHRNAHPCFRVPKWRCSFVFRKIVGLRNGRPTQTFVFWDSKSRSSLVKGKFCPESGPAQCRYWRSYPEHHESKGAPKFAAPPIQFRTPPVTGYLVSVPL
mgnify:CR=1 FL=1